ncbi:hypothetical protein C447_10720 [Halococcus hamelinensis 100A6]|uniref:Luciferase n=2 Tax=Halococcus hamelinensis TaxID=332168 RepID=M0M1C7_9EURY|nr:hypothetical protein [Halococcus hamelinensis]EMA38195.1 hypothetical protein C447_10720 [Halococcus hamelinensis 100A6]
MTGIATFSMAGFDGVALKPTEVDLDRVSLDGVETAVVDYEGRERVPSSERLADLARGTDLRVTTPVRADGFDPLGDDRLVARLPPNVGRVVVAGNPAYLSANERSRAIAPRLGAARERSPGAWVGTEGVERIALAAGGTQFELLEPTTLREVRALRAAGFEGEIAVYAPVVFSEDEDVLLDALGGYVSRRGSVAASLDTATDATGAAADGTATDATAAGRSRSVLLSAIEGFALAGPPETIDERVDELRAAGVDVLVGYPARGPTVLGH